MYTDEQRMEILKRDAAHTVNHFASLTSFVERMPEIRRLAGLVQEAATLPGAEAADKALRVQIIMYRSEDMPEPIRARYLARRGII